MQNQKVFSRSYEWLHVFQPACPTCSTWSWRWRSSFFPFVMDNNPTKPFSRRNQNEFARYSRRHSPVWWLRLLHNRAVRRNISVAQLPYLALCALYATFCTAMHDKPCSLLSETQGLLPESQQWTELISITLTLQKAFFIFNFFFLDINRWDLWHTHEHTHIRTMS